MATRHPGAAARLRARLAELPGPHPRGHRGRGWAAGGRAGVALPAAAAQAAALRLAHPHASLAELAARADPPFSSKPAAAGQLRRLHRLAGPP